jgi:hypothetical protein
MNMNVLFETNNNHISPMELPQWAGPPTLAIPYKGMMLSQEVKLLHRGKEYCVFQAPNQSICSIIKDSVYMHGRGTSSTYIAHVDGINPQRGWIILSRFVFLHSAWRDRLTERVQPDNPMYVSIRCSGQRYPGNLDNLSISGLGVLVYRIAENHCLMETGKNVKIEMPNFYGGQSMQLEGTLVSINHISHRMMKIGIKVYPNNKIIRIMEKYIYQRRNEILNELDTNWLNWNEPRCTKDLFF